MFFYGYEKNSLRGRSWSMKTKFMFERDVRYDRLERILEAMIEQKIKKKEEGRKMETKMKRELEDKDMK